MAGLKLRDLVARLRIVFDKKAQQESEESLKTGFDRITDMAKKVGVAIAAAFAVERIVAFGKAAVRAAIESEIPWRRLENTLANVGVRFEAVEKRLRLAQRALREASTVGDEEFAETLDRLVSLSGDFEKSLQNVQLVADVAAKFFNGQLAPATDLVGRALAGNVRAMRQLGITTKDATEALRQLAERSAGAAANELNTYAGQIARLKDDMGDLLENTGGWLLRLATGSGTLDEAHRKIRRLADAIEDSNTPTGAKRRKIQRLLGAKQFDEAARLQAEVDLEELGARQNERDTVPAISRRRIKTPEEIDAEEKAAAAAARAAAELVKQNLEEWEAGNVMAAVTGTVRGGGALAARAPGLTGDSVTRGIGSRPMTGADLILSGDAVARARQSFADIEDAATNAAFGISGAFQDTFAILIDEFGNVAAAAEALGRGITGALLGGVAQYAGAKVKENVALSFEEIAKGIAATANPFLSATAPGHFAAAAKHAGAAALWGVLAGGAGAGQSAVANGGRGGRSGGIPSGAADVNSRLFEGQRVGPQTILYIQGFNPQNPVHVRLLGQGMREVSKTDSSIDVRPWDGRKI